MKLLEPLRINSMTLPNRVMVPAMVTRLSGEDGYVNDAVIDRYVRYAEGRVGLIVVEATAIHGNKSGPLLRLSDDSFIPGHRDLVRRVRDASDSKIVPQIIHFLKVARSGWRQRIDSLSEGDIDLIVEQFGAAAGRAREAGYDGVEIHSAHAYTLSSFLSRHNPRRDAYDGRTLEGRLRMFGRVMAKVRERVGADFPVGVRFLAEEAIKDGYALPDAQRIALRMAQLGVDYISLSIGGKFEDAVHKPGQPLYPYTGYSGDRCMPGDWYPSLPHADHAAGIKRYLNSKGFTTPVVSVGKISDPLDAERLLEEGRADLIGMARQLLTDPDWMRKVMDGRANDIIRCIYCNVCKQLDENFKLVTCFLWPKGMIQAPREDHTREGPRWHVDGAGLAAELREGQVRLTWRKPEGDIAGYDVHRAEDSGASVIVEAVKSTKFADRLVLGGLRYTYHVRAFDKAGRHSTPSNSVSVDIPFPSRLPPPGLPSMLDPSAHLDHFAREHLPPREEWPVFDNGSLPELNYPKRLNAAVELLDRMVEKGFAARPCLRSESETWSYGELLERANRIANALVSELGLVPGERVLLRDANTPMMAACWFAVLKAGAVAVATMPLLRARELTYIIEKARVRYALTAEELAGELDEARRAAPVLEKILRFRSRAGDGLEALMARQPATFANVITSHDDVALIAFTSGTTGAAKGTMHFHRDVLAICDCFPPYVLKAGPDDIFCGSPPLAFTFGLGGMLLFPMRVAASTLLLPKVTAEGLLQAIERHRCTLSFTAPTLYRAMAELVPKFDISSLRKCVSAGETLPLPIFEAWQRATGIRIIDGIGSTEMLHIFISASGDDIRPGATGKPIPGYQAMVVDEQGRPVPSDTIGRLAVRGPTGCRYLDMPEQQKKYVQNGWNLTGDAYRMDKDGYFWYQARTDDMIVSAGYNISGPEVEAVLLDHPKVLECAVIGSPDQERGEIVKAFVMLRQGVAGDDAARRELQDYVKAEIAPYKYPRAIEFVSALPRTETGKIQRFRLREQERQRTAAPKLSP